MLFIDVRENFPNWGHKERLPGTAAFENKMLLTVAESEGVRPFRRAAVPEINNFGG